MRIFFWVFISGVALFGAVFGQSAGELAKGLTREQLAPVVRFLAQDRLEGRAPGTAGGALAEEYTAGLFGICGLQPGHEGGWFQSVPLVGFRTVDVFASLGGSPLHTPRDCSLGWTGGDGAFCRETPVVFAGFGIQAPDWGQDDYAGVDVKGKIVLVLSNDPGYYDDKRFQGKEMTAHGRWARKIQTGVAVGAAGVVVVHADGPAGYNWETARGGWERERVFLPSVTKESTVIRGWIREDSLREILARNGQDWDALARQAMDKNFRAVDLGVAMRVSGRSECRAFSSRNVVGRIPGKTGRVILYTAHLDHLGLSADGQVYNGAVDNASAVAAMILTARSFAMASGRLEHTLVFVGTAAEEAGLLGAEWYAEHADLAAVDAVINYESAPVWKEYQAFAGIGAKFCGFEELMKKTLPTLGLSYGYSSLENQGFLFRSDQYPFVVRGVPAIMLYPAGPEVDGARHAETWLEKDYHRPTDDFSPEWPLDGLRQIIRVGVALGEAADRTKVAGYTGRLPFPRQKAADQ